jgi:hypothetical protein
VSRRNGFPLLPHSLIEQQSLAGTSEIPETPGASKRQPWLLSRKWLLIAGIITLLLIAIICAVVATLLHRRDSNKENLIQHPSGFAPFSEVLKTNFPDPAILKHNGT